MPVEHEGVDKGTSRVANWCPDKACAAPLKHATRAPTQRMALMQVSPTAVLFNRDLPCSLAEVSFLTPPSACRRAVVVLGCWQRGSSADAFLNYKVRSGSGPVSSEKFIVLSFAGSQRVGGSRVDDICLFTALVKLRCWLVLLTDMQHLVLLFT